MKLIPFLRTAIIAGALTFGGTATMAFAETAYLEITLNVAPDNRPAASAVYTKYRQLFLESIEGAKSKNLLIRDEDVQVLHGFDTVEHAGAYLKSALFNDDVVRELGPILGGAPEVRIYAGD